MAALYVDTGSHSLLPNIDITFLQSYGELSQKTGVDQGALECVLRLAISHRIFTEPKDGHLAHSPASRHLANEWAKKAGNAFADDFLPMHAYIAQALERYPQANEFSHAAAAVANGVDGKRSFYDMLNENPERADNFHSTMHLAQWLPGLSWDHLANGYDWASLPTSSTCVDVGGGHGQAAVAVSAKYPHLKWIVQDSAQGISGHPPVPDAANITYMEHDFLAPQPDATKGVDVFFMRWILHNWPDQYCRRILRALIPSMTPESRILIMETVMPRPGSVSNLWERNLRSLDVGQLALGNGRERDRSQWQSLLAGASGNGKFILQRVIEPPGSDLAILEVKWKDHS